MTKPMYCPLSQMDITVINGVMGRPIPKKECTPDYAWAVNDKEEYWCGMMNDQAWHINTRPLKDDAE